MKIQTVTIEEEFIKLQSLMKFSGMCPTGGEAKILIQSGEVLLNGEICTQRGKKVRPGDTVVCHDMTVHVKSS